MIITSLKGGLGNQMFQYAAGLALAEHRRTVLKLDVSWFREYANYESHNRYALSCFNVTEQFATYAECQHLGGVAPTRIERWLARAARTFHFYQFASRVDSRRTRFYQQGYHFFPGFFDLADNTFVDGLFQSEQFFRPVANHLRLHFSFRYPAQPAVAEMAQRISSTPSAAVHFRRGDYVRDANYSREMGVLNLDYYTRAVALLLQRQPALTLYIFSDDIDAIEREYRPPCPHVFVRATQPWHSYDKIRLMSLCDHAIISNSTFAWWAAWLIPSSRKQVIAPDPWFAGNPAQSRDLVPADWLRLPVQG